MEILQFLARFYGEATINRFLLVAVAWIIWPGLMFAVGVIFESREVPLIKHQSKAFFPGDLTLGVMLVAFIGMYSHTGIDIPLVRSSLWWPIVAAVMVVVGWKIHLKDAANYPLRAAYSPTKIAHDVMGYFIIPTVLIGLGVPQIALLADKGMREANRMGWLAVAIAITLYLTCVALDVITYYDTDDIHARHPEDWQPIWKTHDRRK